MFKLLNAWEQLPSPPIENSSYYTSFECILNRGKKLTLYYDTEKPKTNFFELVEKNHRHYYQNSEVQWFIPKKFLVLGDYNAHTGFATVLQNLIKQWRRMYGACCKFDICSINYFGDAYYEDENTYVFSAIKSVPLKDHPEGKDDFGRFGFMYILKNSDEYDAIFIIQDAPIISPIIPFLKEIKVKKHQNNSKAFKSIFYFPCDNKMLEIMIKDLEWFDGLVTYNEYGREQVCRIKPHLRSKLKVIPHGIDHGDFFPLTHSEAIDFREDYFSEHSHKYIILNLNRNQFRKDIPCTVFGFKEYWQKNKNSILYLHMNPLDPMGWDIRLLMMQVGLEEGVHYILPPKEIENHGASIEMLNKIYNACDVYLTTTLGEGWGLGVTEAMAAGIPVICPMHTSFVEIGDHGKRVYGLENLYPYCGMDNTVRQQCDYLEVSEKLEEVHNDRYNGNAAYYEKIEKSVEYVKTLAWDKIGAQWNEIFKKAL